MAEESPLHGFICGLGQDRHYRQDEVDKYVKELKYQIFIQKRQIEARDAILQSTKETVEMIFDSVHQSRIKLQIRLAKANIKRWNTEDWGDQWSAFDIDGNTLNENKVMHKASEWEDIWKKVLHKLEAYQETFKAPFELRKSKIIPKELQ